MADQFDRLQGVLARSLARKPRTLRELASDLPGEDWSVRDISAALLVLREAGYVRFAGGAWHSGAEWGKVGHCDVVFKGCGPWDVAQGPFPGELDTAAESRNTAMIRWSCLWGF